MTTEQLKALKPIEKLNLLHDQIHMALPLMDRLVHDESMPDAKPDAPIILLGDFAIYPRDHYQP